MTNSKKNRIKDKLFEFFGIACLFWTCNASNIYRKYFD